MPSTCSRCKDPLRPIKPRAVIAGLWICSDCVYKAEYGGATKVPVTPRAVAEAIPPPDRLFSVDSYTRPRGQS